MAFTEDFSAFFNTNDFAVEILYTPKKGNPFNLKGIFENEFIAVNAGEVDVSGSAPKFTYETANHTTPEFGEKLRIEGKDYHVVDFQPDGTGITTLILEESDDSC